MSPIRTQLRSAMQAYQTCRYPGDLPAEVLGRRPARARPAAPAPVPSASGRRWMILGTAGASAAAAAALLLSLLLSRGVTTDRPYELQPAERALADWLPIGPGRVPLPRFQPPALPLTPRELRLPAAVPPGVEKYQDLAMQYRQFQIPQSLRHTTVPTIPADLPSRGVEWLQKVWTGDDKSA